LTSSSSELGGRVERKYSFGAAEYGVRFCVIGEAPALANECEDNAVTKLQNFGASVHGVAERAQRLSKQLCRFKIRAELDAPAIGQYQRHSAWTLVIPCAAPAGYFDSEQPFASRLDIAGFYSLSIESSLQGVQRHSANSAKLAPWQATGYKLSHKPLDLLARAPTSWSNFFRFCHPPTSTNLRIGRRAW
jgi:hypothetical protein